ncbi:MAG: hypothetical protein JWO36_3247 [Myxococcales bacterium]|nr:hypothetical protein [Myxococcales bacterium]
MVKHVLLIAAVLAGCQGQRGDSGEGSAGSGHQGSAGSFGNHPRQQPGSATQWGSADPVTPGSDGSDGSAGSAKAKPEEPEVVDAGRQIAELGAVPAWQAVVDRTLYLDRRGQHGVVFGTVGPAIMKLGPLPEVVPDAGVGVKLDAGLVPSDFVWLVDDTEGNGALAIRAKLGPKGAAVKQGDRIAAGGAWALDEERKWYWKVDSISPLPAAPKSTLTETPVAPGHVIANGDLPQGARTISLAKDGDAVYFQLVGQPPAIDGDGWPVADELGNPVYALLNLPGERPSYGAQDLRAPDERWQLKRGQTYAVRIGNIHKHGPDKPVTINARTAPVRVN